MRVDFGSNNQDAFNDLAEELVKETLVRDFKIPYKIKEGHNLSLENIKVTRPDSSPHNYLKKKTLGESLVMRVYADVVDLDPDDKKVATLEKKVFLGVIPLRTPNGTYLLGNDYNVASQPRNGSSVYTTVAANGKVNSAFQLAKGRSFKLSFSDSGLLRMKVGVRSIQATPLLYIMDFTDKELKEILGPNLADKNSTVNWNKFFSDFNDLFFYNDKDFIKLSDDEKKDSIRKYMFEKTRIDTETTQALLGINADRIDKNLLDSVLRKLVRVYRREDTGDDRWDLRVAKIITPSHLFADRLSKQLPKISFGIQNRITGPESIKKTFTNIISKPIKDTVLNSDLSRLDPQYNMMGTVLTGKTITPVGEGAISSTGMVENKGRQFHPTQTGIVDLTFSPQGNSIGISLRTAPGLTVDKKGTPYIKLKHIKSGRTKDYPINKLQDIFILFPGEPKKGKVKVLHDYEEEEVPFFKVTHIFAKSVYADSMQYTPLTSGMQGPRGIMAATQLPQAVPLVNREAPRVISMDPETGKGSDETLGKDYLERLGLTAPIAGTVKKISETEIRIVSEGGQERKIETEKVTPLQYNTGIRIFPDPKLKVGDKIRKGQALFLTNMHDSTGRLAVGTHLKTAWMVDAEGYGIEDGVVISESAAKNDLVSEHFYKKSVELNPGEELSYKKLRTLFKHKYTVEQFAKIDQATGVIKEGVKVNTGDLISCKIVKRDPQELDKILGRVSRSLSSEIIDTSDVWDRMHEGEVLKVDRSGRKFVVVIATKEEAARGSKFSGRFGNKGVVSIVRPDADMPIDKITGERIDMVIPALGVPSRVNPAQIQEGALGETGKKYIRDPFSADSNQLYTEKEMVKYGLPVDGKHTVFDPLTGEENEIGVGKSYILKLFSPEKSISARGVSGAYDGNKQPVKGGKTGSKALGLMEFYGLLGHNAKGLLKEFGTIKSEKNIDFWRQYEMGMANMPKATPFTFGKFNAILTGAGAQISRSPEGFYMVPVTDKTTSELSKGRVITEMGTYRASNLGEIKGGLFDVQKTGGKKGELWSEYKLADGIPHPMLSQVLRVILDVSKNDWDDFIVDHDGKELHKLLTDTDIPKTKKRIRSQIDAGKDMSNSTQALRFLENIKNFKDTELADFIINKLPVVPPRFRPMVELPDGTRTVNDLNYLYMDVMSSNKLLKDSKDLPETKKEARKNLIDSVSALVGLSDPRTKALQEKGVKGALTYITGKTSPKEGFFLNKMMKRQMINTGRARIIPDPTANMDEVGIPEYLAWNTYEQHLRKELRAKGFSSSDTTKMITEKDPRALVYLKKVLKENYVLINRPPSLHKWNIIAGKPHIVDGPFISIPAAFEMPLNADYDGDEVTAHAPVTAQGKKDAENMLLQNKPFTGYSPWDLTTGVDSEAVAGLYMKWDRDPKGLKKWWSDNMPADIALVAPMDKGAVKQILREIGKKQKGGEFGRLVSDLNRIGIRWASSQGLTVSLGDIKPMSSVKSIVAKYKKKLSGLVSESERRAVLTAFQKEMLGEIEKLPDTNNLKIMVKSKAKSNPIQLNSIVGTPGVYLDTRTGEAKIVTGNTSDGYSFSDHLKMNAKARDEMVRTKMSIAGPGDLYKQMAFNTRQGTIIMEDCGTLEGIEINPGSNSFKSDDLMGRLLAEDLGPYKRNTIITPDNLADIIGFDKIIVRSPNTCEADKGMCARCYGADDDGNLFEDGTPINITAINSFSKEIAQKSLNAKHSVRSVEGDAEQASLFEGVKNLLTGSDSKLSAPIAENSGEVLRLDQRDDKSYDMYIDKKKYHLPYPLVPTVKKGEMVSVGTILAEGAQVNTKQIGNTLGLGYARNLFTETLHSQFADNGIHPHQRNVEVLARELYKYVEFLKPVAGFLPGDIVTIQEALPTIKDNSVEVAVDKLVDGQRIGDNKAGFIALDMVSRPMVEKLKKSGYKRILVLSDKGLIKPVAKGISTLPLLDSRNWLDNMGFRYLKKNMAQALASGDKQVIDHRISPITSYVTNIW